MAHYNTQADRLHLLQSSDQSQLLDEIDNLRSQGISHYVSLPQLIVCGDQSSGKSSVLEAISGISFPTKDNLCTRFATEVILRKASNVNIAVAIVPGQTRSEAECERLQGFRETLVNIQAFPALVDKAKDAMNVSGGVNAFSNDVLRVEISGPDRPHLTIVDLPGLIHSENKTQSSADVALIMSLVRSYMENTRSIILAVISAKNDYANQIILKLAKEMDPTGRRTLGIITKPDTLSVGSESEAGFIGLAKNEDVEFRLGWHVLRNRSYENRETTMAERDLAESEFLSQGIWNDLPRSSVGIVSLRDRLSKVLLNQIKAELPNLVEDIQNSLQDCQNRLIKLGGRRITKDEQRIFLLEASQSFQILCKAAVDGTYNDSFFGHPRSPEAYKKRLRAVVQNLNLEFAQTMRVRGHYSQIVEREISTIPVLKYGQRSPQPKRIERADLIDEIRQLLKTSRGRELPGMFNPLIVGDLFYEQSQHWETLAREHLQVMKDAVRDFLTLTISHLVDEDISEKLFREVIDCLFEEKIETMNSKLEELLEPHQKGHPITYNHYFTDTIQNLRRKALENDLGQRLNRAFGDIDKSVKLVDLDIKSLVVNLATRKVVDMDDYACSEVLLCMQAYYKAALKSFVDNVTILAVEACLIKDLGDIFRPVRVMQMTPELVEKIAAESQDNQIQREHLTRKKAVLASGLATCKRHVGLHIGNPATSRNSRPRRFQEPINWFMWGSEELQPEEGSSVDGESLRSREEHPSTRSNPGSLKQPGSTPCAEPAREPLTPPQARTWETSSFVPIDDIIEPMEPVMEETSIPEPVFVEEREVSCEGLLMPKVDKGKDARKKSKKLSKISVDNQ